MNITTNALQIGDTIQQTGLAYCEADNTYTVKAWACAVRSRLPQHQPQLDALEDLKVRLA